jgi:thioesterase domain-containing protein
MSKAMGVEVHKTDSCDVILSAPFESATNNRDAVFGGQASSLAILTVWTIVHVGFQRESIPCRVMIQKNAVSHDRPKALVLFGIVPCFGVGILVLASHDGEMQ